MILKKICAAGLSLNRTTLTGNANKEELLLLLQVHLVDKEIPVRLLQSIVRLRSFQVSLHDSKLFISFFVTYIYLTINLRGRTVCDVIDNQRGA